MRRDAQIAALADAAGVPNGDSGAARAGYGVRRPDGPLDERQSPEGKAWLAHLADQLARISDGHDRPLHAGSPHRDLAVDVGTALVESGFDLHDCAAHDPRGGVCLTPTARTAGADAGGVLVAW